MKKSLVQIASNPYLHFNPGFGYLNPSLLCKMACISSPFYSIGKGTGFFAYISGHIFLRICVGSTSATEGLNNVNESSVILNSTFSASSFLLFLFLGFNFRSLATDFTGTSQRTVNLKLRIYESLPLHRYSIHF